MTPPFFESHLPPSLFASRCFLLLFAFFHCISGSRHAQFLLFTTASRSKVFFDLPPLPLVTHDAIHERPLTAEQGKIVILQLVSMLEIGLCGVLSPHRGQISQSLRHHWKELDNVSASVSHITYIRNGNMVNNFRECIFCTSCN